MTFTYTVEEINAARHRKEHLREKVKMKIAKALLMERLSRRLKIAEVSEATKILSENIENIELCRGPIGWRFIATLLKYYGKTFQISLRDISEQKE